MNDATFLTRVILENYKSIARCDVALGPLSFLVGANGSGKSNFLDALGLVADSLRSSLDHAIRDRGGINEVRLRSGGHPTHFGIRLEFSLHSSQWGYYAFRVGALKGGGFVVQKEECSIVGPDILSPPVQYTVREGKVTATSRVAPAASSDRLYLVNASGLPEFRPLYEALSSMGFYNLNPDEIRDLQPPDTGELLARDGSNLASVLGQLQARSPGMKQRVEEYLGKVVPGVQGVAAVAIGSKETLEFRQQSEGSKKPWRFLAANMSDGTLRALGILVALFQSANGHRPRVPLVGIEEPEVALHPAAAGVLLDALRDASQRTQVLVTSHSPELLDDEQIPGEAILAVMAERGLTRIGPLDEVGRSALRDRLYTPGELLRLNQLAPDPEVTKRVERRQLQLFRRDLA
ncbi:MAG: AAA family ATPase [Thermoanaerobaculia bacterium]